MSCRNDPYFSAPLSGEEKLTFKSRDSDERRSFRTVVAKVLAAVVLSSFMVWQ